MQISRIRLSDKTSRLRPRHVVPKPVQAYEPEVPVQVREWIAPALAPPPDFVLGAQPPTQPHCRVVVERSISRADGAYLEVVRPSAQHAVQLAHQHCGLLPCPVPARSVSAWIFSTACLMLFFDGRCPRYALPFLAEYIRPNVYPRKSNSPSGTLQIRVFSSFTVSFSLPMISRRWCSAASALPLRNRFTEHSARLPRRVPGLRSGPGFFPPSTNRRM